MIIVFVIDTSASMNQKLPNGMTFLDCAKGAVEHFLKVRGRDTSIRNDRFFLVTSEDGNGAIKAGWKEPFPTFMQEVKNLTAKDLSGTGPALKKTFDLLNQFRLQIGIDNYGQGRNPWYSDPALIILLTDGGALTTTTNILDTLTLPLTPSPGSELTMEPFRWDQRLFSIVLRLGGVSTVSPSFQTEPLTAAMCEVTGGKSHVVTSMKALLQTVEGLVQKLQPGVVVNFEPVSGSQVGPGPVLHKMIYVRSNVGFWPIPESFLTDQTVNSFPPRLAHPTIRYAAVDVEPSLVENFPFDKYELEPSPLTQFLLQHRQSQAVCWQTYVTGSNGGGIGEPFGYLKASTTGNVVSLFVLPYNYPRLWPLLEELLNVHKLSPTPKWRQEFEGYLLSIPAYYYQPMRMALKRFGAPNAVPDQFEGKLNYNLSSYLMKLKQTKSELDRKQTKDAPTQSHISTYAPLVSTKTPRAFQVIPRNYHQLLAKGSESGDLTHDPTEFLGMDSADSFDSSLTAFGGDLDFSSTNSTNYKNPFDITKDTILDHLEKLKDSIKGKTEEDEGKHLMPIGQMGNYQDVLTKRETLRDVLDEDKTKRPMFGNPFRLEKGPKLAIDEADEADGEAAASRKGFKRRRSASPRPHSPNQTAKLPRQAPPANATMPSATPNTTTPPLLNALINSTPPSKKISQKPPKPPQAQPLPPNPAMHKPMPKPTNIPPPVSPTPPMAVDNNTELKNFIIKELKKPTKQYEIIFEKLKLTKGTADVKKSLVQEIIQQAKKYKKAALIGQLEQYERTISGDS